MPPVTIACEDDFRAPDRYSTIALRIHHGRSPTCRETSSRRDTDRRRQAFDRGLLTRQEAGSHRINLNCRVSFGTSGHRGTSQNGTFTESHILAITQALIEYRRAHAITGPLYLGKDTHALSAPAERTALEVLAANGIRNVHSEWKWIHAPPPQSHTPSFATIAA